jgi:Peptidase S46
VRRALWTGGQSAIDASTDPMILLAKGVDADARAWRKRYEDEVEAPTTSGSERIARARFATEGTKVYPDATFTLRLNYGKVAGWTENGKPVEPFTRLGTAFDRSTGQAPFRMPDRWLKAKPALDLDTRFNLSTTNDIVGGNSGSPLINARGELVGLLFDGNIHSISGSYWYDAEKNRAVAVHPAIIGLALTKVYRATALAKELGAK